MEKSVARDLAFVKSKVISRLLESDEFAKVMLRKEDFTDDEKNDMEYTQVFDYPYVDGTQEEVMPFVCIETVCRGANRTTKSIDLYIWIFVHRDCMQMNKQHIKTYMGNRADVLTDIIERLLWGSNDLGIGNPSLSDIGYIIPQSKYFGRQIKYNISDFNTKEVA